MFTLLTLEMAIHAFENKDYKAAVERFEQVLEADPTHRNAREYLARAHFHRASLGKAEQELRRILADDPTNDYCLLLLARTLERQSRGDDAAGVRRQLAALTGDESHLRSQSHRRQDDAQSREDDAQN
ncbi:tetratricopeptide repeat protein [Aestuariimicrobium ganziense]|uniref:tetratricopeptide repeat protein n=1 Tax=Aestuariimicrobium ganziense TaxID=2773677 RepID=UPI0019455B2D|nr:tetratricopeptide repeat protein [Aestuariimicrobium ganziense]